MNNSISNNNSNCGCQHSSSTETLIQDRIYDDIANRLQKISSTKPLFVTDAVIKRSTLTALLPEHLKQKYNCTKCADFFRKYGSLAYMDDSGRLVSALWLLDDSVQTNVHEMESPLKAFSKMVSTANIIDTFIPSRDTLTCWTELHGKTVGIQPDTFPHFYGKLSSSYTQRDYLRAYLKSFGGAEWLRNRYGFSNAHRYVKQLFIFADAEPRISLEHKRRIKNVMNALAFLKDVNRPLAQSVPILFNQCHDSKELQAAAVSLAHIGGSFLGAAIDALHNGRSVERALADVVTRTSIENYKSRDISNATHNQLEQAQKAFEKEGLMSALDRRMATPQDLPTVWSASKAESNGNQATNPFAIASSKLRGGQCTEGKPVVEKAKSISVSKFLTDVLPNAFRCKVKLSHRDTLFRLNVPKGDSKPIFTWDNMDDRREYCTLVSNADLLVSKYGLSDGWNEVTQVTPTPWTDNSAETSKVSNLDPTMLFIMQGEYHGSSESNVNSYGTALKGSLYQHRLAIDAALLSTSIEAVTNPAIGIAFSLQMTKEIFVRVEDEDAIRTYKLVGFE